MPFPPNTCFSCLALDGAHLGSRDPSQVDAEIQVSGAPPIDLDQTWVTWLGTIQADKFRNSGLVITAQSPLGAGDEGRILDRLQQRTRLLHYCLLLHGCAFTTGALLVSGYTRGEQLHVGPLQPMYPHNRAEYRNFTRTTAQRVGEAAALLPSIELIYSRRDAQYLRLRLGFNSWISGLINRYVDERLHYFVRSLEAVLKLPRRRITSTFVERGQNFTGFSGRNEKLLRQLYDLRSCVEHIKNYRRELKKPRGIDRSQAFAFWSLSAELLASEIYKRFFARPDLLSCFQTEAKASGFWRRTDVRRAALLDPPIDVWSLTRQQFRQAVPRPWV